MNTTPWKPAKGTAAGPPGSLGWRKRLFIAPPWPSPLSPARRQCSPPPHADRLMPPRAPLYLERPQQARAPPSTIPTSPASPTPHPCLPRLLLPGPGSDRELPPPMPLSVGHPAGLGPCPQPLGRRMQPSLCRTAPPLQPHPRPAPPPRAADSPGQISAPAYRADTAGLPSPQLPSRSWPHCWASACHSSWGSVPCPGGLPHLQASLSTLSRRSVPSPASQRSGYDEAKPSSAPGDRVREIGGGRGQGALCPAVTALLCGCLHAHDYDSSSLWLLQSLFIECCLNA